MDSRCALDGCAKPSLISTPRLSTSLAIAQQQVGSQLELPTRSRDSGTILLWAGPAGYRVLENWWSRVARMSSHTASVTIRWKYCASSIRRANGRIDSDAPHAYGRQANNDRLREPTAVSPKLSTSILSFSTATRPGIPCPTGILGHKLCCQHFSSERTVRYTPKRDQNR